MPSETYEGTIVRDSEKLHMTVHLYACIIGQCAVEGRNMWREEGKMGSSLVIAPRGAGLEL